MTHAPWPVAAPSFVIPAGVSENAEFLAHKVQEVGLCFFETRACLAYTAKDLPPHLRALPLRWHVHLPVDLDWSRSAKKGGGGVHAAKTALAVWEKAAFLRPRFAVLHPPLWKESMDAEGEGFSLERVNELLQEFLLTWQSQCKMPILLENLPKADVQKLNAELFSQAKGGYGMCLDVGHMLGFGQEGILQRADLLRRVQLVHWSAPGAYDEHLPLTQFTTQQRALMAQLAPLLPRQATHMIEVFRWEGVEASVETLRSLMLIP